MAGRVGVLPENPDADTQHTVEWMARHFVLVRWNGTETEIDMRGDEHLVPEWPEAYECSDRDWSAQFTTDVTEALIFPSEEAAEEVRTYAENTLGYEYEVEVMAVGDFLELAGE